MPSPLEFKESVDIPDSFPNVLDVALSGNSAWVTFSPSGKFLAVVGFDGRARLIDAVRGRIVFKYTAVGPSRDRPIHEHVFRNDEQFYGFSCLRRIFVVDVVRCALVAEVPVDERERLLSMPFALDPRSKSVLLASGGAVVQRPFDGSPDEVLFTIPHKGLLQALSVDVSGRFIACKREAGAEGSFVVLHDRDACTLQHLLVPYDYIPGRRMDDVRLRFASDSNSLFVLSKTGGLLQFDIETGREIERVTWAELGFRSVMSFRASQIDPNGRYLLVNAEHAESKEIASWSVVIPEGLSWVLYDLVERQIVLSEANGEGGSDVHSRTGKIAWVRRRATHGLLKDRLVVRDF